MHKDKVWKDIIYELSRNLDDGSLSNWFHGLKLKSIEGDRLVIEAPNSFISDWITLHYREPLNRAAKSVMGRKVSLMFEVNPELLISSSSRQDHGQVSKKVKAVFDENAVPPETSGLNAKFTFHSFVVGKSNKFAYAACRAVAERKANNYNPLFIYGGIGHGKTHLLNALGNELHRRNPRIRIVCMPAETFMNDMIHSIRNDNMEKFRRRFRYECDVLLMDDVEIFEGKKRTQEEYYYTFNSLYSKDRKIVVTSKKLPREMKDLDDRVKSRMECGIIADLSAPDLETRVAILKYYAEKEEMSLPEEVSVFIAERSRSNVHKLEACLIKLQAVSSIYGEPITTGLAEEVLQSVFDRSEEVITPEHVMKEVSVYFKVKVSDMKSSRRNKKITEPRHIAMYLCRDLCSLSFPEIGSSFGGRDHSTVMHACKKIGINKNTNFELRQHINALKRKIIA